MHGYMVVGKVIINPFAIAIIENTFFHQSHTNACNGSSHHLAFGCFMTDDFSGINNTYDAIKFHYPR